MLVDFVTRQGIDLRLLGLTFVLSISTGLLFGILPALRASRVDLSGTLKEGDTAPADAGSHRVLRFFVVSEIALSVILLVPTGLDDQQLVRLQQVDPGFRCDGLLPLHTTLRGTRTNSTRSGARFIGIGWTGPSGCRASSRWQPRMCCHDWGESVRLEVDGRPARADGSPIARSPEAFVRATSRR